MDLNVVKSDVLGRYLEVPEGKIFKPGELIFQEDALVCGPTRGIRKDVPTCLGCCKSIRDSKPIPCPICEWPVCSLACAKIKSHTNGECSYFRANRMTPWNTDFVDIYNLILIIRCLLLRFTSKVKWAQLLNLQSHKEEYPGLANSTPGRKKKSSLIHLYNFLNLLLNSDFDLETISHVIGLIGVNSFGTVDSPHAYSGGRKYAAILFTRACMMAHSCDPNGFWEIIEKNKGKGNFAIRVYATREIYPGESINIQYLDVYRGTIERRKDLKEYYFFDCLCRRCQDPTEFNSFFSAIKCQECKCGFILPIDSTHSSKWTCNNCPYECNYSPTISELLLQYKDRRKKLFARFGTDEWNELEELEKLLELYKNVENSERFHVNHYILFELRNQIAKKISEILRNVDGLGFNAELDKKVNGDSDGDYNNNMSILGEDKCLRKGLIKELISTAQFQLEILSKICPGENKLRGRLCADIKFCRQEVDEDE